MSDTWILTAGFVLGMFTAWLLEWPVRRAHGAHLTQLRQERNRAWANYNELKEILFTHADPPAAGKDGTDAE